MSALGGVRGARRQHLGGVAKVGGAEEEEEGRRGNKAGARQEERDLSVRRYFRQCALIHSARQQVTM